MTITRLSISTNDEGNLRAVISCLRTELPPFFVFPSFPIRPIPFNPFALETFPYSDHWTFFLLSRDFYQTGEQIAFQFTSFTANKCK